MPVVMVLPYLEKVQPRQSSTLKTNQRLQKLIKLQKAEFLLKNKIAQTASCSKVVYVQLSQMLIKKLNRLHGAQLGHTTQLLKLNLSL